MGWQSSYPFQLTIFELELLPVWIALVEWEGHLSGVQCVFYLDNEAAKASLVNGASMQDNGAEIIQAFVYSEMRIQVKVWFARVPTSSNISDGPGRFDVSEMEKTSRSTKGNPLAKLVSEDAKRWIELLGFQNGILTHPILR